MNTSTYKSCLIPNELGNIHKFILENPIVAKEAYITHVAIAGEKPWRLHRRATIWLTPISGYGCINIGYTDKIETLELDSHKPAIVEINKDTWFKIVNRGHEELRLYAWSSIVHDPHEIVREAPEWLI